MTSKGFETWVPYQERPVKRVIRTHSTKTMKRFPWPVCQYCGLVYLKNEATKKAIRAGCVDYVDV